MFSIIFLKLFRKKIIWNYHKHVDRKRGYALLYYKTDPFILKSLAESYIHTNNWSILEIARILNRLGYWIDIVGRNIGPNDIRFEDKYDIFIGIGPTDSGRFYSDIAEQIPHALKIFYVDGQEPSVRNNALEERYRYFRERHPIWNLPVRRRVEHIDMERAMRNTDVIFCIGNTFTQKTYARFGKPVYRIYQPSSPKLFSNIVQLIERDPRKFLYFAGNGHILKGLDIVIDAFVGVPELELFICAPGNEKDFMKYYENILKAPNIHWEGFIRIGGKRFNDIIAQCGYMINPSSTEANGGAVSTIMRRGLVPIVTRESAIDVEGFGHYLEGIKIDALRTFLQKLSRESKEELARRSTASYFESFKFTQASFRESFEKAIIHVLTEHSSLTK